MLFSQLVSNCHPIQFQTPVRPALPSPHWTSSRKTTERLRFVQAPRFNQIAHCNFDMIISPIRGLHKVALCMILACWVRCNTTQGYIIYYVLCPSSRNQNLLLCPQFEIARSSTTWYSHCACMYLEHACPLWIPYLPTLDTYWTSIIPTYLLTWPSSYSNRRIPSMPSDICSAGCNFRWYQPNDKNCSSASSSSRFCHSLIAVALSFCSSEVEVTLAVRRESHRASDVCVLE